MSSARSPDSVTKPRVAPTDFRLVNWPLRDTKLASVVAVGLVACGFVVGAQASGSLAMGALSCLALTAALWRMWVPVTFEFSASGIVETMLGRRSRTPWALVRRCEIRRSGVLLQIGDDTLASVWRSRYVRWNHQRRELLAILEHYLGPRANTLSPSASTATLPSDGRAGSA